MRNQGRLLGRGGNFPVRTLPLTVCLGQTLIVEGWAWLPILPHHVGHVDSSMTHQDLTSDLSLDPVTSQTALYMSRPLYR